VSISPDSGDGCATTTWMRGASGALRGALLGLLVDCPGHGADLADRLVARLGQTRRIDVNDVYRLLEQLEKSGLAISRNQPMAGADQRTQLVYHPTRATSEALTLWMETLLPHQPVRLSWQAKLSVARPRDARRLMRALQAHERKCLTLATSLAHARAQGDSWEAVCLDCSREAVLAQLHAEIVLAALIRLRVFAAHSALGSQPGTDLSTTSPTASPCR
jgi:DNA-binding PadR family transcriptional regulator